MKYTFYTYNVDFNKGNSAETVSLRSVRADADVLFIQEAKHLRVAGALGDRFAVHQNLKSQAKQGVALAWRKGKVGRYNVPAPARRGMVARLRGYVLGVSNMGLRMLPRFINFRVLDFNSKAVCCISTHRPPQRYRRLWSAFDRSLIRFCRRMPFPVVIGMDSNQHTHSLFARQSNMVWYGKGIDGFWVSKSLVKNVVSGSLRQHPRAQSDHHPVSLEFDF